MIPAYRDPRGGACYPLDPPRWCGPGRAPLLLTDLPGIPRAAFDPGARGVWRYRATLPFAPRAPITLGEGATPLLPLRLGGVTVAVKAEWMMPTGSFKDRGTTVMLSLLRAQGVREILEDSSGNGGASVAAYAAAGGIRATILAPESTSAAKTLQMRAHGATVDLIPGSRQDTSAAAEARAESVFYASHAWHPFFLQGTKTLAYEMFEDLGGQAPDNVIVPCGAGSNVLGCAIGFAELVRAGLIARPPRIFAAQPAACAPVADAFAGRPPGPVAPTIAEGTAIAAPVRLPEILAALRASGGAAVALPEDAIAAATRALAAAGMFVEPTAAQPAAALERLLAAGQIGPRETTVLVLTGSGLKAAARWSEMLAAGPGFAAAAAPAQHPPSQGVSP